LALKEKENFKLLASEVNEDYFDSKTYKEIYKFLRTKIQQEEQIEPSSLLDSLENPRLREGLTDLMFEELPTMRFEETLKQVKIRKIQRELDEIDRMINKEPQNVELFKRKTELSQTYRQMTKRVVKRLIH
jgi:replicative DNA helicase